MMVPDGTVEIVEQSFLFFFFYKIVKESTIKVTVPAMVTSRKVQNLFSVFDSLNSEGERWVMSPPLSHSPHPPTLNTFLSTAQIK